MSWSRTPPYVTEVLGFWPDANKIYGASSSPAVGYFFTNDTGLTWTPTTQVRWAATAISRVVLFLSLLLTVDDSTMQSKYYLQFLMEYFSGADFFVTSLPRPPAD